MSAMICTYCDDPFVYANNRYNRSNRKILLCPSCQIIFTESWIASWSAIDARLKQEVIDAKAYIWQSVLLVPYLAITSFIAILMFAAPDPTPLSVIFALLYCGTSSYLNWVDRWAPIRVHMGLLLVLGFFKLILAFFA